MPRTKKLPPSQPPNDISDLDNLLSIYSNTWTPLPPVQKLSSPLFPPIRFGNLRIDHASHPTTHRPSASLSPGTGVIAVNRFTQPSTQASTTSKEPYEYINLDQHLEGYLPFSTPVRPVPPPKRFSMRTLIIIIITTLIIIAIILTITFTFLQKRSPRPTVVSPIPSATPGIVNKVVLSSTVGVRDAAPLIEGDVVYPDFMVDGKSVFGGRVVYGEGNIGRYEMAKLEDGTNATTGVAGIHAGVMVGTGKVVFVERWDIHGAPLKSGTPPLPVFSSEFDTTTNTIRPLTLVSNVFCGAGALLPDGRIMMLGGAEGHEATNGPNGPVREIKAGERVIRFIKPSSGIEGGFGEEDWVDRPEDEELSLREKRWYPTVLSLPDGRIIAIGGSDRGVAFNTPVENIPSLEIFPRTNTTPIDLPFLRDTLPANLYGVSSVLPSGRIFFFAANKSTALDPSKSYGEVGVFGMSFITGTSLDGSVVRRCVNGTRGVVGIERCVGEDVDEERVGAQAFSFFPKFHGKEEEGGLIFNNKWRVCMGAAEDKSVQMMQCDRGDRKQMFTIKRSLGRTGTISSIVADIGCLSVRDNVLAFRPCPDFSGGDIASTLLTLTSPTTSSRSIYRYFEYPDLAPGPFRSYPLTGFGSMLPLDPTQSYDPRILICGGSDHLSIQTNTPINPLLESSGARALDSCGLLRPERLSEAWTMDTMPTGGRVMADMVLLPDGTALVVNGAGSGMAGWDKGRQPQLTALLYLPLNNEGDRWRALNSTTIPRLYHSTGFLLPDGRVMVAGSAPNAAGETLPYASYQTDYTAEYYVPHYLTHPDAVQGRRPVIVEGERGVGNVSTLAGWHDEWDYGTSRLFTVRVPVDKLSATADPSRLQFSLMQSGFRTHSTGMSERHVWLRAVVVEDGDEEGAVKVAVECPLLATVAPPGWYMLFVVLDGIPGVARWVQIGGDPAGLAKYGQV